MAQATKAAQNIQVGDLVEFMDDLYEVSHVEQADTTDGNNVQKVRIYFEELVYGAEFSTEHIFLTF